MKRVYGPGDDNYGKIVYPPSPIPEPDPITTKIHCKNCNTPLPPSVLEGAEIISDSAAERYERYRREEEKQNQMLKDAFGPGD